ncbi:AAA family ATPase, partial [Acinetobacter pittii]|uniref:AAA family ATPase n=1 Tax=Acinetobacter pittii TaxID=48296 RepID=UPI000AB610D1
QNRLELYNYIFSLKFLDAHYDLQNNGKSLDQLSPGEKGALLLIFYLVLDKEDIPLIIDQPEDNLDNNSVAKVLVPYIKYAKKKRQIILVTHNPNLAVVADSEQVINVSLDKINGNKFSLISGGIENREINKRILEVLEGTIPAFCLRKDKYQITQSSY